MTTTQDRIHAQVQAGIDARIDTPPLGDSLPLTRAARRMLGVDRDRTSVEDAARAAYTPTGPTLAELEAGIRRFRTRQDAA